MPVPHIRAASLGVLQPGIQASSYRALVHVHGSGELIAIGVADGRNYHFFKITIDDQTQALVDGYLCATTGPRANNGMSVHVPFETKLTVEVRDDGSVSPTTRYWAAWSED